MDAKKRLLSSAILLTFLCAEFAYATHHPYYLDNSKMEASNDDEDSLESILEESKKDANPYITYNEELKACGKSLSEEDIAYLATLSEYSDVVAISSTTGLYDIINIGEDGAIVVRESGKRPRVADKDPMGYYYYDIMTGIYASEEIDNVALGDMMSFKDFVSNSDLDVAGYCLPNFWKCEASNEALAIIAEVYGREVAEVIKAKGLPVAFYSYQDIYEACSYTNTEVKGLRNKED